MKLGKNQRRLLEYLDGKKGKTYHDVSEGSYQFVDSDVTGPMVQDGLIEKNPKGDTYRVTAKGRKEQKKIG